MEKWSQAVMWKLLPRHMEIIEEIDKRFIAVVQSTRPDLESKLSSIRVLDHNPQKPVVCMANLCVVSSHTNKTNGITPRRWLRFCSPELSHIITKWLKTDKWVTNLDLLTKLRQFADNEELYAEWESAKMANKQRLAQYVMCVTGVSIDPNSHFDTQVKRIHEYKRQLLIILGTVYRYKKIKVVLVPNYNVSVAEMLILGSELSQHISTAGMEASGTSNVKFALNGCLIIGTLDGANVEIREEIGEENFFLFGARAEEVSRLREERENGLFKPDPRF
ncbi:hypothetical protein ACH5RR_020692 [Cinchona calisaya]|uniref:Alpha-1,4 glucan phosphorylase n=1 Tax=Cinchona calisaya TaxID=153742 RepID=A0ABD2ZK71_9GENT